MVDTIYVQSKAYTSLNCTTQFVLFKAIKKKVFKRFHLQHLKIVTAKCGMTIVV